MRDSATRPMPRPSNGDGSGGSWRVDVASMEVLPERGLADAVAGPPEAVGEAAAVADDVAGASAGAGSVPAGSSGAGTAPAGAGAAVAVRGREPQARPARARQGSGGLRGPGRRGCHGLRGERSGWVTASGCGSAPARRVPRRRWAAARGWRRGVGVCDGPSRPSTRPSRSMDSSVRRGRNGGGGARGCV